MRARRTNAPSALELQAENARLRRRIAKLLAERRDLTEERDEYRQALLARFKKESQQDDWSDFDPADYRFSLEDILNEIEKDEKICLPRRNPSIRNSRRKQNRVRARD